MTLQQIEYIVALDTQRNFQKAADACLVTQPTLTMQVKKLEDEIGFKLFNRDVKPLEPTSLGSVFVTKAHQILREMRSLKELVEGEITSIDGTFRMGIIPTLAPYILPILIPHFAKNHPNTKLVIEEVQSEILIDKLKSDQLDFGVLATPLNERSIREIPIFYEPFLVYLSPNDPLSDKKLIASNDLEINKVLVLSEGHCFRNQTLNICSKDTETTEQQFSYQSGTIETIKALVNKGMGYTLVPEMSVLYERKNNPNIKRFEQPEPVREVSIIVHSSFTKELLIDATRKAILSGIPDSFKKNERFYRVKWR